MNFFSWLNKPKPCKHRHHISVVAFDPGYHTKFTDTDDILTHHLEFQKCAACGENRCVVINDGFPAYHKASAKKHSSIALAVHLWKEKNELQLSKEATVFCDDYETNTPLPKDVRIWKYKPLTGIDKILKTLANDKEFSELASKHQMVDDAFGQLEVAVKLCSEADTTE